MRGPIASRAFSASGAPIRNGFATNFVRGLLLWDVAVGAAAGGTFCGVTGPTCESDVDAQHRVWSITGSLNTLRLTPITDEPTD